MSASHDSGPAAFRTIHESGSLCDADEVPPALIVNPVATLEGLLAAIESRVERLNQQLQAWTVTASTAEAVTLGEVVEPLAVLAEEAVLLVAAAMECQRRAARPS